MLNGDINTAKTNQVLKLPKMNSFVIHFNDQKQQLVDQSEQAKPAIKDHIATSSKSTNDLSMFAPGPAVCRISKFQNNC